MPTPQEYTDDRQRARTAFVEAQAEAEREVYRSANLERAYRKFEAQCWTEAPRSEKRGEWTGAERDAWVSAKSADLRYERDVAAGLTRSKFKFMDFLLADMSSGQTEMSSYKAEAKASGWDGQP